MKKALLFLFVLFSFQSLIANDVAKVAELYKQRAQKEKLDECIALCEKILTTGANRDVAVYLAKAYYFKAEAVTDNSTRVELFDKGVKAGEVALNTIERYSKPLSEKQKEEVVLKSLTKDDMDALYWTAANLARYGKYASFTKKLAVKSRVRYFWDRIMEIDPDYNYGGVYRFFGGYYALVPSITGEQDPVKSKEMFEKGVASAPYYLETKVLYAEAYCTHGKVKNTELFRQLLNEVLVADVTAYADIQPENDNAKVKAKDLLSREIELFD
jgi:hypothetical protein